MEDVSEETIVAIVAEGKQHALGIGITKLSAEDIRMQNKGIGIELIMYLNDGMWRLLQK